MSIRTLGNVMAEKQTGTFTVQYINPPREGKKMGSIKDNQGNYWQLWPNMLDAVEVGGTYNCDYHTSDDGQARFVDQILAPQSAPPPQVPPQQQYEPGPHPQPPLKDPAPWEMEGNKKDAQIFVTGVVGRAMGSGRYTHADIQLLADGAMAAYERLFGRLPS